MGIVDKLNKECDSFETIARDVLGNDIRYLIQDGMLSGGVLTFARKAKKTLCFIHLLPFPNPQNMLNAPFCAGYGIGTNIEPARRAVFMAILTTAHSLEKVNESYILSAHFKHAANMIKLSPYYEWVNKPNTPFPLVGCDYVGRHSIFEPLLETKLAFKRI